MMETSNCIKNPPPTYVILCSFSTGRLYLDQDTENSFSLPNLGVQVGLPSNQMRALHPRQCAS